MQYDQLRDLFCAFRERDDAAFLRAAEGIIARELAGNHHAIAAELQKALGAAPTGRRSSSAPTRLSPIPRDRRNGDELLALAESSVSEAEIVLEDGPRSKIDRILQEHTRRGDLARHGYAPKSRLLFWGPPGCGKTYTAFFVAHELGLPIGVLRLNAVISSFLGDTASHLQRVFDLASNTPMVLLVDEVDAVGKRRDDPNDVGELKRIVNSLLQAMDSFRVGQSVVIAGSNHQYLLDPALWRRFDEIVHFPMPGPSERERQLRILLSGVEFTGSLARAARITSSLSYGDIERVTIEAVKTMVLDRRSAVRAGDLAQQVTAYKRALKSAQSGGPWCGHEH